MKGHRGILAALTGIEDADESLQWDLFALTDDIDYPPTYAVFHTLCTLAGFRCHAFPEKSVWQVHVRYKGQLFSIQDWKRGAWLVYGPQDSPHSRQLAEELRRKIAAASRIAESSLESLFAAEVERGNFHVENSYHRVRPVYDHFRREVTKLMHEREETTRTWREASAEKQCADRDRSERIEMISGELSRRSDYLWRWTRRLSYAAVPMVVLYFSYTEIVFDVLFALGEKQALPWVKFRGLRWDERFKEVLPVSLDARLHQLYQSLLEIKRVTRDPIVHGYGCDEALLVPMPYFGLIPVSYEPWAKRFHLPSIPVREEAASRARDAFDQFDDWLDSDRRGRFAILYARSGFPIPFEQVRVNEVRSWMSSPEAFQHALEREAEHQDALQDHYP